MRSTHNFQSLQRGSVIDFRCQHGPEECEGNKVQSCALNAITTQQAQLQFVGCQMQYGADSTGQTVSQKNTVVPNQMPITYETNPPFCLSIQI